MGIKYQTTEDIVKELKRKYAEKEFVIDKSGTPTVEIIGATFIADEPMLLREPNHEYITRELQWYRTKSRFVKDIPGTTPQIWEKVSNSDGMINSNYGWCIFSEENYDQYVKVLKKLSSDTDSRQASMIYTRPSMHEDSVEKGMSDFMCTFANQFFIRDGKLVSHYIMRSNDSVFGYNNDYAWAKYVQEMLAKDLNVEVGDLIWTASSLHVYSRHFDLLED